MDITTIKEVLGLDAIADDVQVLEKIQELRGAAGERFESEHPDLTLIRRGEHEQVGGAADGGLVVALSYPIRKGNLCFEELTFRRPRLKDVRRASVKAEAADQLAEMISAMTGQAASILDEMDTSDFALCGQVVAFLGRKPPRAGSSS